ncbi:hypothetical protein H4Q26_012297 [Puccinia striiformis f. sp. tritici PST-130]|nr:hypothetical protein H4Q26_012297 [Puccinia striiformis f. sp. tritici PST-130]
MNSKGLPFYTDMSSAQLTNLFELLRKVAGNVRQIVVWLKSIRGSSSMPIGIDWLFTSAPMLKRCLEPQLPLVSLYLVPLVPDTSGFSAQTHYKDWLIFWLAQLGVEMALGTLPSLIGCGHSKLPGCYQFICEKLEFIRHQ